MSWEIDSVDEIKCPCGKGKIIRENRSDDWNNFNERVYLACSECAKNVHIEAKTYGYGVDMTSTYYLVKNGESIQEVYVAFSSFEACIAGQFYLEEIEQALLDMERVKFSTQLSDETAKTIVSEHKKKENTVKLAVIIPKVLNVIKNYNDYEWNKAKIEEEQKRRSNTARIHISFAKERKGCNTGRV